MLLLPFPVAMVKVGIFAFLAHAALFLPGVIGFPSQPSDDCFDDSNIIRGHAFSQNGGPQDDLPITHRNATHYPVIRLPYASYRPATHNVCSPRASTGKWSEPTVGG